MRLPGCCHQSCCKPLLKQSGSLPCAVALGCSDDGSGTGTRYPQGTCTLKTQALTPGSQPAFWATGMVVPWESGYIS
jgi:hypothetical protein